MVERHTTDLGDLVMKLSPRLFLPVVTAALFFVAAGRPVRAQSVQEATSAKTVTADKAEGRTYALIDEAIAKAQTLRLPENRIRLQTAAACLLWPRDEGRARAVIKESMNALTSLISAADKSDPHSASQAQAYTVLRLELVQMIAARDAKLALDFLRNTRQERSAVRRYTSGPPPDQERALELTLAAELTHADAKEAARIAEESLSGGVAAELLNVLAGLSDADGETATALATDTVKRLQSEDPLPGSDAAAVAVGLLNMTRPPSGPAQDATDRAVSSVQASERGSIKVDEQSRRDLINWVVACVLATPAARMSSAHLLFNSLPAVMREVEKYAPGQAAAVRAKAEEFRRSLDPSTRAWQKYEGLRRQTSPDALLEAAAKAPPEVGDELYADAAFKLLDGDDPERARQAINNIADPQRRALKGKALEQQLLERSLVRGKLEDAQQRIPSDATPEERLSTLLYLSALATQRKEAALARRFIAEATGMVGGRVQNSFQFSSQLQIARTLSGIDPRQSFAILDDLADQLNDLLTAAAVVDGFGPDCFSEGELKPFVGNMWGELVSQFGEGLAFLAPKDFERALSVAQKLQRDEVRLSVSLRVAERLLTDAEARRRGRAQADSR
jgi:hypothetical protein